MKSYLLLVVGLVVLGLLVRMVVLSLGVRHYLIQPNVFKQFGRVVLIALGIILISIPQVSNREKILFSLMVAGMVLNTMEGSMSGIVDFVPLYLFCGVSWLSVGDVLQYSGALILIGMRIINWVWR